MWRIIKDTEHKKKQGGTKCIDFGNQKIGYNK